MWYFILVVMLQSLSFQGTAQDKIRIACVGNSITYGAFIENREQNSYPAQLGSMLGEGYEVENFGRNGATLLKRGNLPYWEMEQYQDALDFNPDWVFIKLGTNDTKPVNRVYIKQDFLNDYRELVKSFKNLPSKPKVVLLLPVPVFREDTVAITASVVREQVTPLSRQLAYETGCEIINLYNLMIDKPELLPDKVHPNATGATIIAKRLAEFIRMESVEFDIASSLSDEKQPFNFHGFQGYDFEFMGRKAKVVTPKKTAIGHPWVWRARFFGHEPQADIALLERGFHIAYCDVAELFGNDESMEIWDGFYRMLTDAGLAQKSFMEGMSRGGVYIYRWAAKYPERVTGVYADAPVLDLKSWPGGKGVGKGSPEVWETFKLDYGFKSERKALKFKGNPIDLAEKIAKTGIPMLHIVGDADEVVPVAENTTIFEERVKAAGGKIQVIHKPGIGHHPHSLENPQPIVDFALKCTDYLVIQDLIQTSY
ncbi:MAG: GDSL-type esterase/lipase family protein [Cyclobacteriaceae bacterium]